MPALRSKKEELAVLEREYERFSPYMTEEGRQAVAQQGFFVIDGDGDYTTPLIGDADCAYACRENGTTLCAIEKAWREGRTAFSQTGLMPSLSDTRHEVQRRQRRTALPPLGYLCTGPSIRQEKREYASMSRSGNPSSGNSAPNSTKKLDAAAKYMEKEYRTE